MNRNKSVKVLSIDPGTTCTGSSIIELFPTDKMVVKFAETIHGDKLSWRYRDVEHIHGARYARILAIGEQLLHVMRMYKPQYVVCESPFINSKRPAAYGALVEVLSIIRFMTFQYNHSIALETIDPSTIKKTMGVKGTSGDKNLMKNALQICGILYEGYLTPYEFDEHTVDAICAGIAFCNKLNTV